MSPAPVIGAYAAVMAVQDSFLTVDGYSLGFRQNYAVAFLSDSMAGAVAYNQHNRSLHGFSMHRRGNRLLVIDGRQWRNVRRRRPIRYARPNGVASAAGSLGRSCGVCAGADGRGLHVSP